MKDDIPWRAHNDAARSHIGSGQDEFTKRASGSVSLVSSLIHLEGHGF